MKIIIMNKQEEHLHSDSWWKNKTREAFADWIVDFGFTYFITLNFNKWRQKDLSGGGVSKKVYSPTPLHPNQNPYKPYQKKYSEWFYENRHNFNAKDYWAEHNRDGWSEIQKVEHGLEKIYLFDKALNQKLFGKNFYKKPFLLEESFTFLMFPEKLKSNLHFHGFVDVKNSARFPKKRDDFINEADGCWSARWTEKKKDVDGILREYMNSICPGGQVWLEKIDKIDDLKRMAIYSTKEHRKEINNENYYITGIKTSKSYRRIKL